MQLHLLGRALVRAAAPTALALAALCGLSSPSRAQIHFSIDYRGVTIGVPATFLGVPITAGDILAPATPPTFLPAYGPLPPPTIVISGGFGPPGPGLGILTWPVCLGVPPAIPCPVELDALSYGTDFKVTPGFLPAGTYVFSVDACSTGIAASPLPGNVTTEGLPLGDAAGDIFEDLGLPPGPLPPVAVPDGNAGIVDGNGLVSPSGHVYPGVGIVEPSFPGAGPTGDNIDALDFDTPFPPPGFGVFFSLDAAFVNPCTGVPNTGSAMANGFLPGMVLLTAGPGGPPIPYAFPPMLGLDLAGPPGSDDLDALALAENGFPGFQPSMIPYDWVPAGGPDMLLFSVRRGSAVVGMPDSIFGIPIEPGDILTTPKPIAMGGVSPFPGIFIAAEWLGLTTMRSGAALPADLDALDTRFPPQTGVPYCFGTAAACPCGNGGAPGQGCASTANASGALLTGTGLASVAADSVMLLGSSMPAGKLSLYFQGTARLGGGFGIALNDGLNCAGGGGAIRLGSKTTSAVGTSFYPDPGLGQLPVSVRGMIPAVGATRHYTIWYRDPPSICGAGTIVNFSNGFSMVWTP
jgi:hypothetical protein